MRCTGLPFFFRHLGRFATFVVRAGPAKKLECITKHKT